MIVWGRRVTVGALSTMKEEKHGKGRGQKCVVLDLVVSENNSVQGREQAV